MFSRAVIISHLSSALFAYTLFVGTPNVQAQTITTTAGNGSAAYSGDNGPAAAAALNSPRGTVVDSAGNIFVADMNNACIRKIGTNGTITTVAGIGVAGYSGDGGPAAAATLNQPEAVALDAAGNLVIADSQNRRLRRIDSSGTITTIAGTGVQGYSGDGGLATSAMLQRAVALAVDSAGNIYFADSVDNRVRKIATNGIITTMAGTGFSGYSGDVGPAASAMLSIPLGVAVDSAGNLYIADAGNHVVRKVTPGNGFIYTAAGNGAGAGADKGGFFGDGGPASLAELNTPEGVGVDPAGNIYIADTENYRIRKVTATSNVITTIAGTGTGGFSGDGGLAIQATMNLPWSLALDAAGNLYIGDMLNNRIRKITPGSGIPGGFPTVSAAGTVNSASFAPGSNPLAPGTITSIFGTNLNNGSTLSSSSFGSNGRLVTSLGGASVTFNGFSAPLFASFSGQLNVEVPMELAGASSASVVVTVGGQSSAPSTVLVGPSSPGIFTIPSGGSGQGAIQIANTATFAAPTGSISGARPAVRGVDFITIFCTGLGAVSNSPTTGTPAPGNPSSYTISIPQVNIGGIAAMVTFSGLAPGSVGLYQVNVQVPAATPTGDAIPLVMTIGGRQSNQVTVAVQ